MEIALVIGLLIIAVILFSIEKFSVDGVTIALLLILIFSGILTPQEAFVGFSSDFIVILASIFIITGALSETGFLDTIASKLVKIISHNRILFTAYTMIATSFISAFMNNTTVTALVIGPVTGMCKKLKIAPSKVLMPVAFASILGGTCTLIGTSTNIAVSGYLQKIGMEPLGFFEFLNIGLIISVVGILYMIFIGQFFLPERKVASYTEDYEIRQYLTEIVVKENSKLVGQNVFTSDLSKKDIRVVKIIRNKEEFIPFRSSSINAQDILLVECKIEDLIKIKETSGIEILADVITDKELQGDKIKLAEVLITPTSNLINKTLKESKFRLTHDLVVLAIHRLDENITSKIGSVSIKTGDLLLIQGSKENIESLRAVPGFRVLGNFQINKFRQQKGIITGLIFIMAVIAGSFELAPLSVCFLTASLFTVIIGAISAERVYRLVEWRLLILIGGMTAFGTAMQKSGAAEFLAFQIINVFGNFGVMYVLTAFVVLVVFLTQPLSNAAAALVVLPVALNAAELLHVNPRTFAIAIMLSASVSLITPFEPSCILVYGPGKYKFADFLKTGSILTFILIVIIVILVPKFWPL